MKNYLLYSFLPLFLLTISCEKEDIFQGEKITYEEALAMQSLRFLVDGEEMEGPSESIHSPYRTFFCRELSEGCNEDKDLFYKSFSFKTDEVSMIIQPGVMLDSDLINYPGVVAYIHHPFEARYFLKNPRDLKKHYIHLGSWIGTNERNVKVFFNLGDPQDSVFYVAHVLQASDQFEVTEVQKIKDQKHSFLVSGHFRATLPDGRTWLPPNERKDPVEITEGRFTFILEPNT